MGVLLNKPLPWAVVLVAVMVPPLGADKVKDLVGNLVVMPGRSGPVFPLT
jgi:hypothetical protein